MSTTPVYRVGGPLETPGEAWEEIPLESQGETWEEPREAPWEEPREEIPADPQGVRV